MQNLHSVLSLVNYIDHQPVHVVRICDDVTGEYNQVAIVENCLTSLDLVDRPELIGQPVRVAKADYNVIDAHEFPIRTTEDLYTLGQEYISFIRNYVGELSFDEASGSIEFLETVTKSIVDEDDNWIGEGEFKIVNVLLEPAKDE